MPIPNKIQIYSDLQLLLSDAGQEARIITPAQAFHHFAWKYPVAITS